VVVGFLVGFHLHTNAFGLVGAVALLLLFGFAMSWVMALLGLVTKNAEAAQAAAFPLMALLVFASNSFVSTKSMPGPLRAYADHQPVSATVNAVRSLVLGGPTLSRVLVAVAWSAAIIAVFAPFAVRRYRQAA
jgi:ABC-2 type transport system permease protein/oleandomycin transport system permease protein